MLVMFRFENFGPFKDEAVMDMRSIKSYKEHPYNLITSKNADPLLKVASIYGANASGKSNFVDAFWYFGMLVQNSFQKNNREHSVPVLEEYYNPFLLDEDCANGETEFEAIFREGDQEYHYGFRYNKTRICYEWLYRHSLVTKRPSIIFERSPEGIALGNTVRSKCEKYLSDIDTDVLALSFFGSLRMNIPDFTTVLNSITGFLPVSCGTDGHCKMLLSSYFSRFYEEADKPEILKFLEAIDVGIKDISVERRDGRAVLHTYHMGADGELCRFPLELESDGTIRALALFNYFKAAAKYGGGILIDELHNQLHPLLQKYLIDLIYESNEGAQLIYTTHDISMLDNDFMRRDQIWFTEKDTDGEATLRPLSNFSVRNDVDLKKAYLSGRYGGIPKLQDFSFEED